LGAFSLAGFELQDSNFEDSRLHGIILCPSGVGWCSEDFIPCEIRG
jgi:hypothetical protein